MTRDAQARYAAKQIEKDADGYRKRRSEITNNWRKRNLEKARAYRAVYYAISTGKLIRPGECAHCGKICKPEASHDDYSNPLAVEWLCRQCHMQ